MANKSIKNRVLSINDEKEKIKSFGIFAEYID